MYSAIKTLDRSYDFVNNKYINKGAAAKEERLMNQTTEIKTVLDRLSRWDQNLNFHKPVRKTPAIKTYLNYYSFNLENVDLHFGKVEIDEKEIFVQIFTPLKSKGTIFLLHGYLEHVGYLKHIIQFLNEHQYSVVSYDLQGHGLSEGKTASVNNFSDYVLTMEKLMRKVRNEMAGPFYLIGHSTGGAIVINYVLKHRNHHCDKVIMVAPIIRSNYWHLTKLGFFLTKAFPFIDGIKRQLRENSSNKKYLNFTSKDPLQPDAIPLDWIEALIKWNEKIQNYDSSNTNACVIQGMKDKTVEWKYNLEFVKEKFHNLQVVPIENGKHALFNESKQIRETVFAKIHQFLKN